MDRSAVEGALRSLRYWYELCGCDVDEVDRYYDAVQSVLAELLRSMPAEGE